MTPGITMLNETLNRTDLNDTEENIYISPRLNFLQPTYYGGGNNDSYIEPLASRSVQLADDYLFPQDELLISNIVQEESRSEISENSPVEHQSSSIGVLVESNRQLTKQSSGEIKKLVNKKQEQAQPCKVRVKKIVASASQRELEASSILRKSKKGSDLLNNTIGSTLSSNIQKLTPRLATFKASTPRIQKNEVQEAKGVQKKAATTSKLQKSDGFKATTLPLTSTRSIESPKGFFPKKKKDGPAHNRTASEIVMGSNSKRRNDSNIACSGIIESIQENEDLDDVDPRQQMKTFLNSLSQNRDNPLQKMHNQQSINLGKTGDGAQEKIELIQTLVREAHRETLQLFDVLPPTYNPVLDPSILRYLSNDI